MPGPYQPTLNPGALGTDYSGAPSSIGEPIAQALEYGGELMDKDIHQFKEAHRDMEAANAGVQLAQASEQIDKAAIDARANAGAGGAGHTQNVDQMFAQARDQAISQIKDPHTREQYAQRWADLGSQISTREYGWEAATRADYIKTNVGTAQDTTAKAQFSNRDPVAFANAQNSIATLWHTQSGVDDATKVQGIKEGQRAAAINFAEGWIGDDSQDPHHIVDALKDPAFNQYLQPGDQEALQTKADTEIRRRELEAKADAARQKASDAQDISLFFDQVKVHGVIPTEADWQRVTSEAARSGLDKDQFDLGALKDYAQIQQQYRGLPPAQFTQPLAELAAKAHDGKLSQAEQVHYNNLKDFAATQTTLFNSDPYSFEAAAGNVAPQIDATDPSSFGKRVAWAEAVRKSAGLVNAPYLSNDEAKTLTDEIKTGPAGQMKAAAQLRNFGISVGSQIAGNLMTGEQGEDLKLQVGFRDRVSEWYSRGAAAMTGKTVHVGSTDQASYQDDLHSIDAALGSVNGAIPVDMRPAVRRAAINVAAGMAAEYGIQQLTGDQLKSFMGAAVQRVTGRDGKVSDWNAKGGVAKWNDRPGPDGHTDGYIWLPQSESTNSAFAKMSRAGKEDWVRAAGGAPYIMGSNGKLAPLTDSQISQLRKYPLDMLPNAGGQSVPGIYTPITPDGGHLVTKDGKPWQFDIRKLR